MAWAMWLWHHIPRGVLIVTSHLDTDHKVLPNIVYFHSQFIEQRHDRMKHVWRLNYHPQTAHNVLITTSWLCTTYANNLKYLSRSYLEVHCHKFMSIQRTVMCTSLLCRTMACFHVISTSLISDGDHPCAHYFLWILPLCALLICSMTHYDITMGHDVVRDAPLWNNNE